LQQPLEDQVGALINQVWGQSNDALVKIGTDYINGGGNWADALLYLASDPNNRDALLTDDGLLQLTTSLTLGESGWSANAGDDQLFGDAGDDLLIGGLGNNLLDGGEGFDMAAFVGVLADYTLSYQQTAPEIIDLVMSNIHSGDTNILRNIEWARIGDEIYQAKVEIPVLLVDEMSPLSDFVQLVGVDDLQALPGGWLV